MLERQIAVDITDLIKRQKSDKVAVTVTFPKLDFSLKIELDLKKLQGEINRRTVFLDKTRCNYGGYRYWFLCPGCEKRAKILYFREEFQCRKCAGLTYASQQHTKTDCYYWYQKAVALATSLDSAYNEQIDFFQYPYRFPSKPKEMKYREYIKKQKRFYDLVAKGSEVWLAYVNNSFKKRR